MLPATLTLPVPFELIGPLSVVVPVAVKAIDPLAVVLTALLVVILPVLLTVIFAPPAVEIVPICKLGAALVSETLPLTKFVSLKL